MKSRTKNIKKDFEEYVNKFEEIRELAGRFKVDPVILVKLFFDIGLEALKQTESILRKEFLGKLNEVKLDVPLEVIGVVNLFIKKYNDNPENKNKIELHPFKKP